jgi:hypothetical protein
MNPFVYPREKYRRRLRPGQLGHYREYKPFLRTEFARKCVYCRMPDTMAGGADNYGVDHYKPKSLFRHLLVEYTNLFYCCNKCNRRKGTYWPTASKLNLHFVPNVCDHVMAKHMSFSRAYVETTTPAGKFTVDLLDLNDAERRAMRELILDTLSLFSRKRAECQQTRAAVLRRTSSKSAAAAKAAVARLDAALVRIDANIAKLSGM